MTIDMLIHDKRLKGNPPAVAQNQWDVDATTRMDHIVGWTGVVAQQNGGLRKLIIMCHGYESAGRGGYGLQLGKDDLKLSTVDLFTGLRDKVKSIIVYACAAADTAPKKRMTSGDGSLLMSRLAVRANCYVVASSATQIYSYGGAANAAINFGSWEGDVYLFGPNGNKRLIDWGWVPD
jgi:hypothetical protein